MRNPGPKLLLTALFMTASAGSAFAQSAQFHRVTTTASSGARSPSARAVRSTPARDVQAPRAAGRATAASTSRAEQTARLRAQTDVLHPYSSRSAASTQSGDRGSESGRFSTWREQPQPAATTPRATEVAQSHNYYPTLRSGVYVAQPVRLTANAGFYPGSCSPCRSRAMMASTAGAHHR